MSYRSLKRVLGETSIERKCRLLFGLCLLLLISGAFYWVEHITEELIKETTRRKGRDSVDLVLLKLHWNAWETDPDPELRTLLTEVSRDLLTQRYEYAFLRLEEDAELDLSPEPDAVRLPESPAEAEILRRLRAELEQQLAEQAAGRRQEAPAGGSSQHAPPEDAPSDQAPEAPLEILPVHHLVHTNRGAYYYYQPVYWKRSCFRCHRGLTGQDAYSLAEWPLTSLAEGPALAPGGAPYRVVKVVIPDTPTQRAMTWNRAILISTAIGTVFLAMIALYIIVRYVIVKPLTHLRDVSDAVSRGEMDVRADIHTGDEFEQLAASFNRMLRHLIDAQAELRQVNADLDSKVDQLARLNMQLYEMNRLKSDFLANMSHELRTPLNSIIGFSEVLEGIDSLTPKQKRYARNIQKSGRVLLEMINDILDLAKLEAGRMDVRPSDFRIDTIVHAQCDMMRSLAEEKNIDVEVSVEPDLPPLWQDQSKIQQILTNLLSNAVKFTPEGGRVSVAARRDARGRLELTVADTGVGIAEEDREVIFEKFRQSRAVLGEDGLTRAYSGTGLGLSIVKELCKLLGGEIALESELGKGSTFRIYLPWSWTEERGGRAAPRRPAAAAAPS